ncbi:MAG: Rpn family recombination-promoting nuclease/putative transposase [Deltaproteobacteria bacterium]|nr:Rpn family recombination-promoting nuclease/putative transposase [Deltaproteobacteria bacterium]
MDFINAILKDTGFQPAVKLEIMNPFNLRTFNDSKVSILDVKAEDENRRVLDIEIQVIGNSKYIKRSLYYWAKNYHGQLKESDRYNELNPVICVNILDFTLFKDLKKAHTCFLPTELNESDYVLTDDFQIHFFELSKMNIDKKRWIIDSKNGLSFSKGKVLNQRRKR